MKTVAVIGGGITGLTAAFELEQRGTPVMLYEATDRAGGPIQTVREQGYLAECGPNTILETSPAIAALVRDLGLADRRLYSNPGASNRYLVRNGKVLPLPSSVSRFLRTRLFSGRAKMRLALEPFIRRATPIQEESVAEFVERRLGQEFLDYAIDPLVAGIYAGDPSRLSVKHAFPKLHAVEQEFGSLIIGQILGARARKRRGSVSKQNAPKFSFDTGLDLLTRTLHERLQSSIRLGQSVHSLRPGPGGWTLTGDGFTAEHSGVIVAIPGYRLANLAVNGVLAFSELKAIEHPPVASVVLGFRRDDVEHPLDGFGVLVPKVEKLDILGTIFSSSLFPGRAPEGHVTLTSYVGGCRAPELAHGTEATLARRTLADLTRLLGVKGPPTFCHIHVFRKAIPQYNVGYGQFLERIVQIEAHSPGLLIGGHSRCGISISDSIQSGLDMAGKMQLHLKQGNYSPTQNDYAEAI